MVCPQCNGSNVTFQMIQTNARSKNSGMGCLWGLGRLFLIICTCGLWLIIGKRKGSSKTTFTNQKHAICQSCGYSWNV